jgi:hypothetical protein
MSKLFWLTEAQMARLEPFFPKSHGKPRVDDRRVLSGIIFINRNGLRWCDAPKEYGPHKTLYNRWKRWSEGPPVRGRARWRESVPLEAPCVTVCVTACVTKPGRGVKAGPQGRSSP